MNFKDFLTTFDTYLEYENLFSSHYYGYVNNVFVEKKLLYPLLVYHVDAMNHSILDNSITVLKFNFFVFDKLKTDNSNVIDVQDDLLKKLVKIQSYLKRKFFATNFNITAISDEAYSEKITGWILNCEVKLDTSLNSCFPSEPEPEPEPGLEPELLIIDGLKIWLKADYGVVYDENNKVSEWHDASGNGYIFSQNDYNLQPIYISSIDSMNNKPTIKFYDDFLVSNQFINIGTFFILTNYIYETFQNYSGLLTSNIDKQTGKDFILVSNENGTSFYYIDLIGDNLFINNIQTYDFSPLKKPKLVYGYLNEIITWDHIQTGRDRNYNARFWHGDVYEVIIYDRILNSTEIEQVKNYLREKYAMDF